MRQADIHTYVEMIRWLASYHKPENKAFEPAKEIRWTNIPETESLERVFNRLSECERKHYEKHWPRRCGNCLVKFMGVSLQN